MHSNQIAVGIRDQEGIRVRREVQSQRDVHSVRLGRAQRLRWHTVVHLGAFEIEYMQTGPSFEEIDCQKLSCWIKLRHIKQLIVLLHFL